GMALSRRRAAPLGPDRGPGFDVPSLFRGRVIGASAWRSGRRVRGLPRAFAQNNARRFLSSAFDTAGDRHHDALRLADKSRHTAGGYRNQYDIDGSGFRARLLEAA